MKENKKKRKMKENGKKGKRKKRKTTGKRLRHDSVNSMEARVVASACTRGKRASETSKALKFPSCVDIDCLHFFCRWIIFLGYDLVE